MLVFDIETDGLLDTIEKIHCINIIDRKTGKEYRFNNYGTGNGDLVDALAMLEEADEICGHNIIEFDIPAIQAVFPHWHPKGKIHDTKVYSRLIWTNLRDLDFARMRKGKLPQDFGKYVGSHSLRPWGIRLGFPKDDFDPANYGHTWKTVPFSKVMDDYCMQDVRVTTRLMELIESKGYSARALDLEIAVAQIISRQQRFGFMFDTEAAIQLTRRLQERRLELEQELRTIFPPWLARDGNKPFTPKRDNKVTGYVAGAPFSRIKPVVFNPGSRDHIANRLMTVYGWRPTEFTPEGKPKIDETILDALPYPEAKKLAEYMMVVKRLGQIAEGEQAWLKAVGTDGRIHGSVNTNGAVTGRMTHFNPNVAQVPRVGSPYGAECRSLFIVPPGKKLVGCDAEGLELRMLGHFMARYDGGEYANTVVNGKKEDGTDVHTVNKRLAGLNSRDNAKTIIYAFLYGAGDFKLGSIVLEDFTDEKRDAFNLKYPEGSDARNAAITRLGKQVRAKFLAGLPALAKLIDDVKRAAKRGHLIGLDGRHLHIRSEHAALNTLLQSAGAVVLKQALVIMDAQLQERGYVPGEDYEWVANVHDEVQAEVKEGIAEEVGKIAAEAITQAGILFDIRCPLSGSYAVGRNWKETH